MTLGPSNTCTICGSAYAKKVGNTYLCQHHQQNRNHDEPRPTVTPATERHPVAGRDVQQRVERAQAMIAAFHVSADVNHDSIMEHGIDQQRGESAYMHFKLEYPAGNYVFADENAAYSYAEMREAEERDEYGPEASGYNVYTVEISADSLTPDPFRDGDDTGLAATASYTPTAIPAAHITHCNGTPVRRT